MVNPSERGILYNTIGKVMQERAMTGSGKPI